MPPTTLAARDAGLVRSITIIPLIGAMIGILIGGGIFAIPADMAKAVGSAAPLAYLAAAAAVGTIMLCFAEAASRVPGSGGPYSFVEAAFGPYWGWIAGALTWVSAVLAAGGIAAAAADALGSVFPFMASGPVRALALMGWFALLAMVNIAGTDIAARIAALSTAVKAIPLLIFVGVGLWFVDPARLTLPLAAGHADIGRAAILGVFLFTGMESTLAVAGEVRDPARTIPRAIIISLVAYAALCITVQLVAQGLAGADLAASKAPLADAMGAVSPALKLLLVGGATVSMLGWNASDALASPRLLFAFARDGLLPAPLGRLHPRRHTPHIAIITYTAITAALAISGSFTALAIISTLIVVIVYIMGCAATLKLRADGVALAGAPLRLPALRVVAAIGIVTMVWLACQSTLAEAGGIALFLGLISLMYAMRRRH